MIGWLKLIRKMMKQYIFILFLLVLLASLFTIFMRSILLDQYLKLGNSIALRYSQEMAGELELVSTLLDYGSYLAVSEMEKGADKNELSEWVALFRKRMSLLLGEEILEPFIVYDSVVVVSDAGIQKVQAELSNKWYKKVLAADGKKFFSKVYMDSVSQKLCLVIARKCDKKNAVIVFKVFVQNLTIYTFRPNLPEGTSVYICDIAGNLIYSNSILKISQDKIIDYVRLIDKGFKDSSLVAYDAFVFDPTGAQRGVYASPILVGSYDIGWNVYVTIPYTTITEPLREFYFLLAIFIVPIFGVIVFLSIRTIKLRWDKVIVDDTLACLSNQYYAIYRVDYVKDIYLMIKGSEYMKSRLPRRGSYAELMRLCEEIIDPAAFEDFSKNFSRESIGNLVAKGITEFGGDFLRRFGEEYRWVNVRVLFDKRLLTHEAVLCFREVEKEKRQRFQERKLLKEALEIAKRGEKSKQAFFSNMSHDMRTPLNAILSLSELTLNEDSISEKVRGYQEKLVYSGRQLLNLVNDILDVSRMEQGKIVLNNQSIDLEDCISECVAPFYMQAEVEKKKFEVEFDIRNRNIMGDPARIVQVLNNLLSNAFKFTSEKDSISVRIQQIEAVGRAQYQFIVSDSGIGISKEFLTQLFIPYSRETRFSNRRIAGTGLGMAIVKNLVTEMSGQIYVDSTLGKGTTFTFTIPFALAEGKSDEKKPEKNHNKKSLRLVSLKGQKILLAEDNVINMEIAAEILTMNGVKIVKAWNGEEAVKAFEESSPFEFDAILMDMQMPIMDGCEASRRIRALNRPDAEKIPIIAVTANAFAEDIAATFAAGMNAHISKPIDFNVLCRTLGSLMGEKQKPADS